MTGIEDVAREAGVSTATVSRALRGLPRVSEATRQRVLAAAARMEYVASPHAASLAGGQTRAIGVVVPNVTRWFFGSVVHGAEELLRQEGYDLLLYNITGDPTARSRLFATHLLSKRVDAVMVLALQPTPAEVASLDRIGTPTVVVGGAVPGWSDVRIDDVEAAAKATQHLLDLGTRADRLPRRCPRPRARGPEVLRSDRPPGRLPADHGSGRPGDRPRAGRSPATSRRRAASPPAGSCLTARQLPTAVFAGSDEMAFGAAQAFREAGLRVPEDISLVGIDDHELAEFFDLTTVAQPAHEMGRLGARLLLDGLGGATSDPVDTIVPTRLIPRRSTARLG